MGIIIHYNSFDKKREMQILESMVALSGFSSLSLSVAFYEPRLPLYETKQNPAYPQMPPIDRMDFIYEK